MSQPMSCSRQQADFQSSPPPKERCNPQGGLRKEDFARSLSILTAPEGAVQSADLATQMTFGKHLSILTAPEGAVQYPADPAYPRTLAHFQSSPPPKERCNQPVGVPERVDPVDLSILTAPEGAVQWAL